MVLLETCQFVFVLVAFVGVGVTDLFRYASCSSSASIALLRCLPGSHLAHRALLGAHTDQQIRSAKGGCQTRD